MKEPLTQDNSTSNLTHKVTNSIALGTSKNQTTGVNKSNKPWKMKQGKRSEHLKSKQKHAYELRMAQRAQHKQL